MRKPKGSFIQTGGTSNTPLAICRHCGKTVHWNHLSGKWHTIWSERSSFDCEHGLHDPTSESILVAKILEKYEEA